MDRTAYVDQQTHLQGQVGLPVEFENRLWRLVIIQDREVILAKGAHELAMLVSGDEQNVYLVHALLDREDGVLTIQIGISRRHSGDRSVESGVAWGERRPGTYVGVCLGT